MTIQKRPTPGPTVELSPAMRYQLIVGEAPLWRVKGWVALAMERDADSLRRPRGGSTRTRWSRRPPASSRTRGRIDGRDGARFDNGCARFARRTNTDMRAAQHPATETLSPWQQAVLDELRGIRAALERQQAASWTDAEARRFLAAVVNAFQGCAFTVAMLLAQASVDLELGTAVGTLTGRQLGKRLRTCAGHWIGGYRVERVKREGERNAVDRARAGLTYTP